MAGDHLVQCGAEGEYVAAGIGFLTFELFRRHVLQCSDDCPGACHRGGLGLIAHSGHGIRLKLRQPEIQKFGAFFG